MLNVRILGNQPEPTLVESGMEIVDFEVRTRDEKIFAIGKDMIEQYVVELFVLLHFVAKYIFYQNVHTLYKIFF